MVFKFVVMTEAKLDEIVSASKLVIIFGLVFDIDCYFSKVTKISGINWDKFDSISDKHAILNNNDSNI